MFTNIASIAIPAGLVNYALPLTVGNGNQTLSNIIRNTNNLSSELLISTAFGRTCTLAISMNCGFVGGFVFPLIAIAIICGVVMFQQHESYPLVMCISCFLVALPGAICPMPFTLLGIATYVFFLGLQQTVPVFISGITAYLIFTGLGILGALQSRAQQSSDDDKKEQEKKDTPPVINPLSIGDPTLAPVSW